MSFKPIDFQVMMPKVNDVAQLNQNMLNRNQSAEEQLANSTQKNVSKSTKQVVDPKKSENAKINLEDKNKDKYMGNKKNKKKNSSSNNSEEMDSENNKKKDNNGNKNGFDVRI